MVQCEHLKVQKPWKIQQAVHPRLATTSIWDKLAWARPLRSFDVRRCVTRIPYWSCRQSSRMICSVFCLSSDPQPQPWASGVIRLEGGLDGRRHAANRTSRERKEREEEGNSNLGDHSADAMKGAQQRSSAAQGVARQRR